MCLDFKLVGGKVLIFWYRQTNRQTDNGVFNIDKLFFNYCCHQFCAKVWYLVLIPDGQKTEVEKNVLTTTLDLFTI